MCLNSWSSNAQVHIKNILYSFYSTDRKRMKTITIYCDSFEL